MLAILWWYLATTLIGWLCFPLTTRIFRNLPGKGFAFSRGIGLLIWGFGFWFLTSIGILRNDLVSQWVVLIFLIILSLSLGFINGFNEIWQWLTVQWRLVLSLELVFLIAFLTFAIFRSTSPGITGTEKPMELAFLNAILRSNGFPPHDPWLSGYTISYYYFGYLLIAMLTRLTGVASTVAFNLAQVVWFALIASGVYGLLVDLFALRCKEPANVPHKISGWMLRWAVLAPVLVLLLGNAFGFLDVLHARGVFWHEEMGNGASSNFWKWMDLRGLSEPPPVPYQWEPQRPGSVPWWHASRVLQDTSFSGEQIEVIDEFPNFSFVLGDVHPHVLAMPFVLIAIGLGLNAFYSPPEKNFKIGKWTLPVRPGRFLLVSGLIGSLTFLNTWDWPVYAALYSAVFLVRRIQSEGWKPVCIAEFLIHGLGMALVGTLLFLPFFLNFASQAGGFLPSLIYFTRGIHFWVMFGPLLIPVIGFLIYSIAGIGHKMQIGKAALLTGIVLVALGILNAVTAGVAARLDGLGDLFMANQGASGVSLFTLLWTALLRRLSRPGTWLTLSGMMTLCLAFIIGSVRRSSSANTPTNNAHLFIFLLILWGVFLTLIPEFVYLLDSFGKRMNTIFKFYFQAWVLWSLAGAYCIGVIWQTAKPQKRLLPQIVLAIVIVTTFAVLALTLVAPLVGNPQSIQPKFGSYYLDWLWLVWGVSLIGSLVHYGVRRQWRWIFRVLVIFGLSVGAVYPVLAISARADQFHDPETWTLDGSVVYREAYPDLMAAVDWMWTVEPGVVAEAVEPEGGDYSNYGRVSMLTGFPAVLGWWFHEVQWRGGVQEIGTRETDIAMLYETMDWATAKGIIDMYNIKYIYAGDLERSTYDLQSSKFQQHLELAFQQGTVAVYRVTFD